MDSPTAPLGDCEEVKWCKQPPSLARQDRARLGRIEHERTGSRSPGRFQAAEARRSRAKPPPGTPAGPGQSLGVNASGGGARPRRAVPGHLGSPRLK